MKNKIIDIYQLAQILKNHREQGEKIVLCHGVFDLLHIGHIRHFGQARQMGDVLVVTVTQDKYVNKGPHRPAFSEALRAEAIASLGYVDYVAVNCWPTAEETLRLLRPHIYVKGAEYKHMESDLTGKIYEEAAVTREIDAEMAFTEDIIFSSSNLINRYLSNLPEEINQYMELFRHRHDLLDILEILERMSSLKVMVIGDTILDEYQYCEAIGKSSKDPTLALKYQSHDMFAGGALAVANHVANFAQSVKLVSVIGERNSHETFIRSQLRENISPHLIIQKGAPTLIKRRFIDGYSFNKLFEMYVMDDSGLTGAEHTDLCIWLKDKLPKYDIIVVADFGHGAISPEMVKILVNHSPFLAVNTQANAGNRGLHTLSRYPRADYASIAEHELRLETRNSNVDIRRAMNTLVSKLGFSQFIVSLGRKGCAVSDRHGDFIKVPAFAQNIVDRVGAGDALFSVTSMAALLRVPNEILGFFGNVAGALAVELIGNKTSIDKISTKKYITSLMK